MKVLRYISNIVSTLMIVVLLVLTTLLVGVRIVGLTPYAVLSGSMEPTYHVGSLIYVREIDPSEIAAGMPITFVVNDDLLVATHRVIEVEVRTTIFEQLKDEDGDLLFEPDGDPVLQEVTLDEPAYYFTTKGDANDVVDGSPVYYKNVIGTPLFSVPYLGYFSNWLQSRKGMIVAISSVMILLILTFLPDLLRLTDDDPKPEQKKASKNAKNKRRPDNQPQRKKAARPEGERRPLTEEERAALIARRKARALAAQQAERAAQHTIPVVPEQPAQSPVQQAVSPVFAGDEQSIPVVPEQSADAAETAAPRRRRRRQTPSSEEN